MNFREFAFQNVNRKKSTYLAYFLSSAFTIMIYFGFSLLAGHPSLSKVDSGSTMGMVMGGSAKVILFFSFFFILYSVGAFLKVRTKDFAMMMILGMSKRQFNRMIFLENMIIGIAAILTGIGLGFVFSKGFLAVGQKILQNEDISFYFPIGSVIETSISFWILFVLVSLFTPLFLRSVKLTELLVGGKKPNKEIKFSPIKAVCSIMFLAAGYILIASPIKALENSSFYTAGCFILIGISTYLAFTQLSVFVLSVLKKNEALYMKKVNMLWISNLTYRMKDNANMLFLVTILSAVAFIATTTLYTATTNIDERIENETPFAFTYISGPENINEEKHVTMLDEKFQPFNPEKIQFPIKKMDEAKDYYAVKVSDYNRLSEVLELKTVSISDKEVYLVPDTMTGIEMGIRKVSLEDKAVTIGKDNKELAIKGQVERNILVNGVFTNVFIVDDQMFTQLPSQGSNLFVAYDVKEWKETSAVSKEINMEIDRDNKKNPSVSQFISAIENYENTQQQNDLMFYICAFISFVFLAAAGSFLYFRLYTDLNVEKEKYYSMSKIGLSEREMKRAATIEMAVLFFVPYVIALLHTIVGGPIFTKMFGGAVDSVFFGMLALFGAVQLIYFFIIRKQYIRQLLKVIF